MLLSLFVWDPAEHRRMAGKKALPAELLPSMKGPALPSWPIMSMTDTVFEAAFSTFELFLHCFKSTVSWQRQQ